MKRRDKEITKKALRAVEILLRLAHDTDTIAPEEALELMREAEAIYGELKAYVERRAERGV